MRAVVAGTGFEGRAETIRKYCRDGLPVRLVREPNNPHDPNAIAVYLEFPRLLFGVAKEQIGYIKAPRASKLHKRLDDGEIPSAQVASFYAPPDKEFPRVSLDIEFN